MRIDIYYSMKFMNIKPTRKNNGIFHRRGCKRNDLYLYYIRNTGVLSPGLSCRTARRRVFNRNRGRIPSAWENRNGNMGRLFGTDGVRGKANEFLTPELALLLGKAAAKRFLRGWEPLSGADRPRAVIGKDTRISGYMLETALASGLVSMGMDVYEIGPMPTPAVAPLTRSMCASCGFMITASHNPASDNGIKLFDRDGFKLPDEIEAEIEEELLAMAASPSKKGPSDLGKARRIREARGRYIHYAKQSVRYQSLAGLKVVLDCANGAAYSVAPTVLRELDADLTVLSAEPNGLNINDGCGALHPERLARKVVETGSDLGVALDGDADRVIFCDADGRILNGDRIIGLCAIDYMRRGRLKNGAVAITTQSNMGLADALKREGIRVEWTGVGDRCVIERIREKDLNLGGEQSGHMIFLDYSTTGDGLISALHVLALMKRTEKPLAELADFMQEYPQLQNSVRVREKIPLDRCSGVMKVWNEAKAALDGRGRVIVRYSGTENKIRTLVEARAEADAHRWHDALDRAIREELEA